MKNNFTIRGGAGDLTELNTTTRPQDNLYLAVNSAWQKDAVIPADRTEIGVNTEIDMRIEKRMMADLDNLAVGKEELPKIQDLEKGLNLYKLALDFDRRNQDGAEPIKADLKKLMDLANFDQFNQNASSLNEITSLPFSFDVEADMKNTQEHVFEFGGPATFLPDTTSYQQGDAKKLLGILEKQSINLLTMAGVDETAAAKYVKDALAFDQKLAKVVKSTEEWADYPAAYNPYSLQDFLAKFKSFDMKEFLSKILPVLPEKVIVLEPRFLDHAEELINPANFEEIKGWMITKFINNVATYLSQSFREAAFPYQQAISGQTELTPQKRHAYYLANSSFSEVFGVYYGKKYFGEEAKADVTDMIQRMIKVYEERIQANNWLSEATKEKAIVKLRALVLKIGYPEKIEEVYDLIQVDPTKNLYENEKNIAQVVEKYNLAQLTKPVDRSVWLMPGNMNNACYDPQRNDITFPAGILQAPFYDLNQSRGTNYGGIGATIAHEISHAFDNNGAKFDEHGNMKNWWTDEDFKEFNKRTQAVIDIYDGLSYGPSKLNGKQVVAENIADLGGLSCAIQANKQEGGSMKELFENYARSWAQKQRPEAIKTEIAVDVHAPQPTRVNIPAQCQDEFFETFDVKETDGMWLDPDQRVKIW
ncbi:M13 family metallopeptidase [Lactobacillus sp. PV034]|uniref:M13 family metallopeptidase n=1 Tax=Lactobacillus sp. PV034 TaxID=2594495 RepID=UPI00223F560F|nr:M13-type metalloendopeptidase [Lactobacillus sp. PV034]QNQ80626.1 M13 family peptidase [Lactobacillus sp. PV034]